MESPGCHFYSSRDAVMRKNASVIDRSLRRTSSTWSTGLAHPIGLAVCLEFPPIAMQRFDRTCTSASGKRPCSRSSRTDRSSQNYCYPPPQFLHIVVRATMATILPVVFSKRMVIPFSKTVKIVSFTAMCGLVVPKSEPSNHIFGLRGD